MNVKKKNSLENDHSIHSIVINHRPYFRKMMKNDWDAEELEQNLQIKFFEKSIKEPDFIEGIQNLNAYVRVSAKYESINLHRKNSNNDSIDAEENVSMLDNLSDEGQFIIQIERELDEEPYKKIMRESLENFSKYGQTLIKLRIFEGCKPSSIVKILIDEHADLLKSEFPEYSNLSEEELKKRLDDLVPKDCNSAEAKYRQKLKQIFR